MAATGEAESAGKVEELTGTVGGVDKSVAVEYLSDVKCTDDDPLFVFNHNNVMKWVLAVIAQVNMSPEKSQTL